MNMSQQYDMQIFAFRFTIKQIIIVTKCCCSFKGTFKKNVLHLT